MTQRLKRYGVVAAAVLLVALLVCAAVAIAAQSHATAAHPGRPRPTGPITASLSQGASNLTTTATSPSTSTTPSVTTVPVRSQRSAYRVVHHKRQLIQGGAAAWMLTKVRPARDRITARRSGGATPRGVSASTDGRDVSQTTIRLPSDPGLWVYIASKNALYAANVSLSSPDSKAICDDCQAGNEAYLGSYGTGTDLTFTFDDPGCAQSWDSTDTSHVHTEQIAPGLWQLDYDDAGPNCDDSDGDFNDLVVDVSSQGVGPLESLGDNGSLENPTSCTGADPVNCATGNFTQTYTDLQVPGHRGPFLSLQRTYNSLVASTKGMFGYGWTSTYETSLTFDDDGDATVIQGDGAQATFYAQPDGSFVAPPRVLGTLVQNGDGTYTLTVRGQAVDRFSAGGQLIGEQDTNGAGVSLAYNDSGQLTTVTDSVGRTLTYAYGDDGLVSAVTDPAGRSVAYGYDDADDLTSVTDSNGGVTTFAYDSAHLLTTVTDPRHDGDVTNTYDSLGRVTSQADAMGRTTTFDYETDATTITSPTGSQTVEDYTDGTLSSTTRGYGTASATTTTFAYDQTLGASKVTDGNGHVWSATYDIDGNRTSTTDPVGNTASAQYNSYDEPLTTTDLSGATTTYSYDGSVLTSIARPLTATGQTQTTTYHYDDGSQPDDLTSFTDPDNETWQLAYNSNGELASNTDPDGDQTTYGYDCSGGSADGCFPNVGLVYTQVSPRGNISGADPAKYTTTLAYNPFGEPTSASEAVGGQTTAVYDADGNETQVTNPSHDSTGYQYNADNELDQVTRPDSTTLQYGYNGDGDLTSQTDGAGHETTYAYDPLDEVISDTAPLSRETTYTYDGVGNQQSKTDPDGRTTTYGYDDANELNSVSYSDSATPSVSYTYLDGRRASMTDGTGTTGYAYDSLDRLTGETTGLGNTVSYGYDLDGNVTTLGYPNGETATNTYNNEDDLTQVADWLGNTTTFAYDPDSNLQTTTYPASTGDVDSYSYDNADQVTGIDMTDGSATLAKINYSWKPNGLLARDKESDLPVPTASQAASYTYNDAGSITKLDSQNGYTYDNASELTNSPSGTNGYDNEGDRTSSTPTDGSSTDYAYDQAADLQSVTPPAGDPTSNTYNGDGLLATQTTGTATTQLTWDQASNLPLLLSDGTNSYIYGPNDLPVEQIDADGNATYLHHDQLGSTRLLTDSTGSAVASFTYSPYGKQTASTGTATTPFGYAGQYTDATTGLIYLRARWYDPTTAQFLTADPLRALTAAPYAYASDAPTTDVDPSGEHGLFAAVVGGFLAGVADVGCASSVEVPVVGELVCGAAEQADEDEVGEVAADLAGPSGDAAASDGAVDAGAASDEAAASQEADQVQAPDPLETEVCTAAEEAGSEVVTRYMSQDELDATQDTGLVRGGRAGTHFVTNDSYSTAAEAQSKLALPNTPEVAVQLEVPTGAFSEPSTVEPANGLAGGGTERAGSGAIAAGVLGFTGLG